MSLYEVTIDGSTRIVRSTPQRLRDACYAHIRDQLRAGRSLAAIQFCWRKIYVGTI